MDASEFGKYLRGLRKSKKMTIRQLELYAGVSNAYLSHIENGKRGIPSPDILKKLSTPLGVDYDELMEKAGYIEDNNKEAKKEAAEKLLEYLELELTNEEIKDRLTFKVDSMTLSNEEMDEFIDFVRVRRLMKKQQAAASKSDEL